MNNTGNSHTLQGALFKSSPIGWAAYLLLKYLSLEPPNPQSENLKRAIWEYLGPSVQDKIRAIRAAETNR